ncbi:hypothetical protein COU61_01045 [Candidatus Pacearchaeota archaeon CG10_big_fil_rev_8_21_14_0_10_35_13]|nr:MAG: hypothetical protein COU61_01045 [Candidatus Pacearchaeota archaeon CG10_big_fil_rev_8_21_14_0_10_35_13]
MNIVNQITMRILTEAKDGESINSLASRIGVAYSAVYKWVAELEKYEVINLIRKGNINAIKINKNLIYKKFRELEDAVSVVGKDKTFWNLIRNTKLRVRFVKGTAATIWTKGNFVTGDFYERIYFLEVINEDLERLKRLLDKEKISYTEGRPSNKRPLIYIIKRENFNVDKDKGFPVMPLKELVDWSEELHLENILEHLNNIHSLDLNARYSEVLTNA